VLSRLGLVHLEFANVHPAANVGLTEFHQVGTEQGEGESVVVVGLRRGAEFVLGTAHAEMFEVVGAVGGGKIFEIEREGVRGLVR
jgi:hypothetical protein